MTQRAGRLAVRINSTEFLLSTDWTITVYEMGQDEDGVSETTEPLVTLVVPRLDHESLPAAEDIWYDTDSYKRYPHVRAVSREVPRRVQRLARLCITLARS